MNTLQEQPTDLFLIKSEEMWNEGASLGQWAKQIGPYMVLPRGVDAADHVMHQSPRIAPQTASESSCEYCHSLHAMSRCPSCGAPRRAESETSRTRRFLALKGITGTEADDPRLGRF